MSRPTTSRAVPLILLALLASAPVRGQDAPASHPPLTTATRTLCEALVVEAPDPDRVRASLELGADPAGPCTVTITERVRRGSSSSSLSGITRSLSQGKPNVGKAVVALALLPVLPILALLEGLGRVASSGSRTRQVDVLIPPLHLAVQSQSIASIDALVSAGADTHELDYRGLTPLALALGHAADEGRSDALVSLLDHGLELSSLEPFVPGVLVELARQAELFSLLCSRGLDPDETPQEEDSALWLAVQQADAPSAEGLLSCGADPEALSGRGALPVDAALSGGHDGLLDLLLAHGASLETTDHIERTALLRAVSNADERAVAMALERGVLLDHADHLGNTALHLAAMKDTTGCTELLIAAGAEVTATNQRGEHPLHQAARSNRPNQAGVLVNAGAPLSGSERLGVASPLVLALWAWHPQITESLLMLGAPIGEAEAAWPVEAGELVLSGRYYSETEDWRRMVLALLDHGAPVTTPLLLLVVDSDDPQFAQDVFDHDQDSPPRVYRRLRRRARRSGGREGVVAIIDAQVVARKR